MGICFIVMSVTSEISQLLYLFFDLLVYYPINIHQSQQNLSCEKDRSTIPVSSTYT